MGCRNRQLAEDATVLSEALLFATMCIIGLPVDVHVRDGSVYSAIFHTASVENEYGVFSSGFNVFSRMVNFLELFLGF